MIDSPEKLCLRPIIQMIFSVVRFFVLQMLSKIKTYFGQVWLTIQNDVHVVFVSDSLGNKGKLYIEGTVFADGVDSTNRIEFGPRSVNNDEAWGVEIYKGENTSSFKQCLFRNCLYGLKTLETRIVVEECEFDECNQSVIVSKCDSCVITNNVFLKPMAGIKIELTKGSTDTTNRIANNYFLDCSEVGLELKNHSAAVVTNNKFKNCDFGVSCSYHSTVNIRYNSFNRCLKDINFFISCTGDIQYNEFGDGETHLCLEYGSYPSIQHNNFLECDGYKMTVMQNDSLVVTNAQLNWWGTTSTDEIDTYIFDANDIQTKTSFGKVNYEPFQLVMLSECGVR